MREPENNHHPSARELFLYSNRSLDLDKFQINSIFGHLRVCPECKRACPDSRTVMIEDFVIAVHGYVPPTEVFPGRLEEAKRTKLIWMRDDPDDAFCSKCGKLYAEECECAYHAALKVLETENPEYLLDEGYDDEEIEQILTGEVAPESLLRTKELYPDFEA